MREYAVSEATGERVLIRLRCDAPGCKASIKPGPAVVDSGWVSTGFKDPYSKESVHYEYCDQHAFYALPDSIG